MGIRGWAGASLVVVAVVVVVTAPPPPPPLAPSPAPSFVSVSTSTAHSRPTRPPTLAQPSTAAPRPPPLRHFIGSSSQLPRPTPAAEDDAGRRTAACGWHACWGGEGSTHPCAGLSASTAAVAADSSSGRWLLRRAQPSGLRHAASPSTVMAEGCHLPLPLSVAAAHATVFQQPLPPPRRSNRAAAASFKQPPIAGHPPLPCWAWWLSCPSCRGVGVWVGVQRAREMSDAAVVESGG